MQKNMDSIGSLLIPTPLKPGDRVGVIATSSGVSDQREITQAVKSLKQLGLTPVLGTYTGEKNQHLAGTDPQRVADIHTMFADPSIHGIVCLRGGYGALRILDMIDWEMIAANPKVFVGYSDVTNLHTLINQRCGFVTYHGPMASIELLNLKTIDPLTLESWQRTLFTPNPTLNLHDYPLQTLISGSFSGRLIGGNLAVLASALGTPYAIDTTSAVLFLEDVAEPRYKIDRFMTQLRLAGKLDKLAGVIIGDFTTLDGENVPVHDIIQNTLAPLGIPCLAGLPAGHKLPNITLPLGTVVNWQCPKGDH